MTLAFDRSGKQNTLRKLRELKPLSITAGRKNENGDVDIDRDMMIIGAGADATTITANFSTDNEDRLIHFPCYAGTSCIDSNANDVLEIFIQGVTLTGGQTRGDDEAEDGGALLIDSTPGTNGIDNLAVFLTNVHVTDNSAGGDGGGLVIRSDDQPTTQIDFNDVLINDNHGATATVPVSPRLGGGALVGSSADGGQLFFACDECHFVGNVLDNPDTTVIGSDGSGGGLSGGATIVFADITNSSFEDNVAGSDDGDQIGGAIFMGGQILDLFMDNVSTTGNSAGSAGGVGVGAELFNATIRSCIFAGNEALAQDGGFFGSGGLGGAFLSISLETDVVVEDSLFGDLDTPADGNTAASFGGAMVVQGSNLVVDVISTTFANNQVTGNNVTNGGVAGGLAVVGFPAIQFPFPEMPVACAC